MFTRRFLQQLRQCPSTTSSSSEGLVVAVEQKRFARRRKTFSAAPGAPPSSLPSGALSHMDPTPAASSTPPPRPPRGAPGLYSSGMFTSTKTSIDSIRDQIERMKAEQQQQRLKEHVAKAHKDHSQSEGSQSPSAPFTMSSIQSEVPRPSSFSRRDRSTLSRNRRELESDTFDNQVEDVFRDKATEFKRIMPPIDSAARSSKLETAATLHRQLNKKISEGDDDIVSVLEGMGDEELKAYLDAGLVDPFELWEGSPEVAALPNEFFDGVNATQLTCELADISRGRSPPDDVIPALQKLKNKVDYGEFTEKDLEQLEAYEKDMKTHEPPNTVLAHAAKLDPKLKESLDVLEKAKRMVMQDASFNESMEYSRKLEARDQSFIQAQAKLPVSPADRPLFFGSSITRPPKRAQHGLPAPKQTKYARHFKKRRERRPIFEKK